MAAFDEITWSPRLGSSGDDLYNISGARKIDGTTDTGAPTMAIAGDSSGFSTIPTIAQLNASSGFNQIIGYYNRRAGNWNTLKGTSLTIMPYVSQDTEPTALNFTDLLTNISTLMSSEGFQSVSLAWPNTTPTTGQLCYGDFYAYLRKALRISGTMKLPSFERTGHRLDNPYGTQSFFSYTNHNPTAPSERIGKCVNSGNNDLYRNRALQNYAIPSYLTSGLTSAVLSFTCRWYTGVLESSNLVLYSSNTDDHATILAGTQSAENNANNLINTWADTTFSTSSYTSMTQALTLSEVYAKAGGWYCILFAEDKELAGTGAAPGFSFNEVQFDINGQTGKNFVTITI